MYGRHRRLSRCLHFCCMDIKWKENGVNSDNSIDKTKNIRYS